ncbi:MAG: folate-binding protein [Actinomycetaceae bacterium]|nr:folate-binding protein [Actinomycetaceae bacterium]
MTYVNPFSNFPSAVVDENEGVVLRYRDPAGEQWALAEGSALADLTHFDVVRIAGQDRHQLLTTLSSQIITGIKTGQSRELLLLDPQGHITSAAAVFDDGQVTWAVTDPGCGQALVDHIMRMRFASRVEATVESDYLVVGQILPAGQGEALGLDLDSDAVTGVGEALGLDLDSDAVAGQWRDPWPGVTEGGASYTPANFNHPGRARARLLTVVHRDHLAQVLDRWVAQERSLAGFEAWEALRVEDLRPRFSAECDERTLPAELDWLRTAVHLNKGCYCGQEAVARIINLGKPPRRLVLLQLDGSQSRLVKAADAVEVGGKEVGRITTSVRHADFGPMALAVVRRGLRANLTLDVISGEGPVAASQEIIVDPVGKSSVSPSARPGAQLRRDLRGPVLGNAPAKGVTPGGSTSPGTLGTNGGSNLGGAK